MISSFEGDEERVSSFRADVAGVIVTPLRAVTRCISILMHLSLSLSLSLGGVGSPPGLSFAAAPRLAPPVDGGRVTRAR